MSQSLLVVVHPGSLCGSASMHLRSEAARVRSAIAKEVINWSGAVAVVQGGLDDELAMPKYRVLADALKARTDFMVHGEASEPGLRKAAKVVLERFKLTASDTVLVTGAWNDRGGGGCVTEVARSLQAMGIPAAISENAPSAD